MYPLLRFFLFCLPPETAHAFSLKSLVLLQRWRRSPKHFTPLPSAKNLLGLQFPNILGIAAGLDKNGEYIQALSNLGFGFIEIGTVTPKPQSGNPRPRLFRLPAANALINRMGFNNHGVDYLIEQVKKAKFTGILGINIGKNATTSLEDAVNDYVVCLRKVYTYASYITINISSPNTPGLRQLQSMQDLDALLQTLKQEQHDLTIKHNKYVPLVIKIAPDLSDIEIKDIATCLLTHHIDAVIATNTTLARESVSHLQHGNEAGGLSGKPLFIKSCHVVQQLHEHLQGAVPIIACGGIFTVADAKAMLAAGASLIQIYTSLIYQGPGLVKQLTTELSEP